MEGLDPETWVMFMRRNCYTEHAFSAIALPCKEDKLLSLLIPSMSVS